MNQNDDWTENFRRDVIKYGAISSKINLNPSIEISFINDIQLFKEY